jgi:two-component system sensor histidine kinase VanS
LKSDYRRFKVKVFSRLMFVSVAAVVIGLVILQFFVDGLFQDGFINLFFRFCERVFGLSQTDAHRMYQMLVRNNKTVFIVAGFLILLLLFFFFSAFKFTGYFKKINKGIEQLAEEEDKPIRLPQELEFAEKQLNEVRDTLKERQAALIESERRKSELVMYLAHDMKTPLTSVIGYLSLLCEADSLPDAQRKAYTETALRKAQDLSERMNEFFDITRFNLQEITLEKKGVNLTMMLRQIADEFYPLFEKKRLTCRLSLAEGVQVQADADKLARVFDNILKNAAAYAYPESTVLVRMEHIGAQVEVAISNSGNEIPAEKLDRIFEKFYRVDESRSRDTGGTGLGLAIAKEIVQLHGGDIRARSKGDTTEFMITLPA